MFKLLLSRIVLLVPTLFIILVSTYVLSTYRPGDEVAIRLEMSGESSVRGIEQYERAYKNLERELGLSGPKFYWSMVPHYYSDEIHDIVPLFTRNTLSELTHQVKDWSIVKDYYTSAKELELYLHNQPNYRSLSLELNRLMKDDRLIDIVPRKIEEPNDSLLLEKVTLLNKNIANLSQSNALVFPKVKWNGTANQFHNWIKRFWNGNHVSLRDGVSVSEKIQGSIGWTLSLSLITLFLACAISILVAVWLMGHEHTLMAQILNGILYFFYAIPLFWLATLAVVFFTTSDYGEWTHIFPSIGIRSWELGERFLENVGVYAQQIILPVICMVIVSLSYLTRQLVTDLKKQSGMLYSTMARAKGVIPRRLRWNHQLPNALMPYITIVTGALPRTIVGSAIMEVIFNIPGVGKLLLDSIYFGDWPVIFTIIIIVGAVTIFSYLLSDILYAILYPHAAKSILN